MDIFWTITKVTYLVVILLCAFKFKRVSKLYRNTKILTKKLWEGTGRLVENFYVFINSDSISYLKRYYKVFFTFLVRQ